MAQDVIVDGDDSRSATQFESVWMLTRSTGKVVSGRVWLESDVTRSATNVIVTASTNIAC